MTQFETLIGFATWLTTRDEPIVLGAKFEAGHALKLVEEYCQEKHIEMPYNKSKGMDKVKQHLEEGKQYAKPAVDVGPIPPTIAGPAPVDTGKWADSQRVFEEKVLHGRDAGIVQHKE